MKREGKGKKGYHVVYLDAPDSPLYGRSKMATFERYFLADKSMHHESKNAYYHLFDKEETADNILKEFGLTGDFVHIINGHVPVERIAGEIG